MDSVNSTPQPSADVLIIEDEYDTRDMLAYFLKRKGFSVVTAVDREEAMTLLDQMKVRIILLDYMMPGPSATKFLEYLGWHHPETKVVLMTAANRAAVLARMLGIETFIPKPLELQRVYQTLAAGE